ncbi:MAG: anhydro-N-acetylmuramic acid kinase [SAR324 cluster bacterium]|nr:anhydro-N-acetylmuramic acid kinase [SAR324 cluster bacterium]
MTASQNSISRLFNITRRTKRRILGLMSGTSLDGVDLALTSISSVNQCLVPELERFTTFPFPKALKERIQEQMQPDLSSVDQICALHVELGKFLGRSIAAILKEWDEDPRAIDCIASHGQTLYHFPHGRDWEGNRQHSTFQIGDADQIAVQTGIITIADFRMKDIAAGGAGAPLIPYVDYLLFRQSGKPRVLHNLGGISNLTFLPDSNDPQKVIAFDTGPANVLINLAVEQLIDPQLQFDAGGEIAAKGRTDPQLLEELLKHPFFTESPPKSTGREVFGKHYFQEIWETAQNRQMCAEDVVATLTSFTAHSIRHAYENFLPNDPRTEVYFSGGGIHNNFLMQLIQSLLPHLDIRFSSELGINADAREAISFAVLAYELLSGNPVTLPGITGTQEATALGKISLP